MERRVRKKEEERGRKRKKAEERGRKRKKEEKRGRKKKKKTINTQPREVERGEDPAMKKMFK